MAYVIGNHTNKTGNGVYTTTAISTTGADMLWVAISSYTGASGPIGLFSDSQLNTWSNLTEQSNGETRITLFYCQAPSTSGTHTFTSNTAFSAMAVMAATGSVATPLDQVNGANVGSGTSLSAGSVTPGFANEIIVTAWASGATGVSPTVSGYTVIESVGYGGGANEGVGLAYQIQTTATTTNPAWSWTGSAVAGAVVGTFKAATGGAAFTFRPGLFIKQAVNRSNTY